MDLSAFGVSPDFPAAFVQVVLIDLTLAGDNAVVIGLAAAGVPKEKRGTAIAVGIIAATVLRIVFLGALLGAARAPFVARAFATDRELESLLKRAIAHPGFAVVEVLELCTAHGSRRNPLGAARMREIVAEAGYALGVLRDEERPRPLERAEEEPEAEAAVSAPSLLSARLDRRHGIVLAGTAGERVQSAATGLARAALRCGLHVSQKNDNPITQGSGFSLSEVILSPRPIDFTGIETPDAVLVVSDDGARELSRSGTLARCGDATIVLADETVRLPDMRGEVRRAPLRSSAGPKGAAAAAAAWLLSASRQRRHYGPRRKSTGQSLKILEMQ